MRYFRRMLSPIVGEATASGVSVLFDDSVNYPVQSLVIEGHSAQNGAPAPDAPVPITGVRSENVWVHGRNLFGGKWETGSIRDDGTDINITEEYARTDYVRLIGDKTYSVSMELATAIGSFRIFYYDENKAFLSSGANIYGIKTTTFTAPAGTVFVRFRNYRQGGTVDNVIPTATMLNEGGAASAYFPFINSEFYPQSLPVLYGLPDGTKDVLDIISGAGVRNIGVKVFDGTENWQEYRKPSWTENKIGVALYSVSPTPAVSTAELCTHFSRALVTGESGFISTANGFRAISSGIFFAVTIDGVTDIPTWKEWLAAQYAAQSVAVIYKLAAPEAIALPPQVIETVERGCYISAGGAEFTATAKVIKTR